SRFALEATPDYPMFQTGTLITSSSYLDTNNPSRTSFDPTGSRWPFGHLLNFFQGAAIDTLTGNSGANPVTTPTFPNAAKTAAFAPHFSRLLDFVEVPSPFSGAERWYNPGQFTTEDGYY